MRIRRVSYMSIIFLLIMVMAMTISAYAKEDPISMKLNGTIVKTEVAPIIESGRTLIPARAFFEAMGGKVAWDEKNETVSVQLEMDEVKLVIGSKEGLVNGTKKSMDVPARIIQNRTMIPVRFVSESLGCDVDWENNSRTVIVDTPSKPDKPKAEVPNITPKTSIKSISVSEKKSYYRIMVESDSVIGKYNQESYVNPKRFCVDVKDAKIIDGGGRVDTANEVFSAIRYSQFNDTTVRVVIDLDVNISGKVSKSSDGTCLYIDFAKLAVPSEPVGGGSLSSLPMLDNRMVDKLIFIDPGHGGSDPGALGKVDGQTVVNEKDVNLSVSLKLWEYLKSAGANVDMTRYADVRVELKDRPAMANNLGAYIFVSIHNNSNVSPVPNGTEVLYSEKASEEGCIIKSKELADEIQKEMVSELGTYNRGARQSPELAVLRLSKMPAVIVEGAFISNEKDRAYMMTDEYIERYAKAVAIGIINIMNKYADEEDSEEWREI